ncbi:hypothetical protein ABZ876_37245 [Streptomyces sp. NPDC046931]|uniref:hypothetical protein n=1 Tax=Streptomyces sp. NPDC046931 TaxID=3154806 RepID=UPI0033EDCF4A
MYDDTPVTEQVWRYSTASFLELSLPGSTVAALLRGDEQDIHGLHVVVPGQPPSSASTSRLRGQQEWDRVTTPWPRTEWTINRDANALQPGHDLLIGRCARTRENAGDLFSYRLRTPTRPGPGSSSKTFQERAGKDARDRPQKVVGPGAPGMSTLWVVVSSALPAAALPAGFQRGNSRRFCDAPARRPDAITTRHPR